MPPPLRDRNAFSWLPATLLCSALLTMLVLTPHTTARAQQNASEQAIKSAFIYNFTKFVSWPPHALPPSASRFTICIAGDPALLSALNEATRGKQAEGRAITLVALRDPRDTPSCQILFISHYTTELQNRILASAKDKPVLTVGEEKGFAARGGIVNFFTVNNRVQFEINTDTARHSGLEISSRMLSLARIVRDVPP